MDAAVIKFKASGQQLSVVSTNLFAANTVNYIRAEFELGDGWDGFDSVRAVWATDFAKIATVLDNDGACVVPWEVLKRTGTLYVNLVGSISDGDELTDRLTTYKAKALDVNGCTNVDGDNTQPITPSQFEQFVAVVHDDAEAAADARDEAKGYADDAEGYRDEAVGAAADAKDYRDAAKGYADDAEGYKDQAKGYADDAEADAEEIRNMTATATTLPEGSSATASYSDGVLSLGIPKGDTGEQGETGNGIASAVLNADYTLTLNFTDGTHYTTPPIRGAQGVQGETGNGIESVYLTETHGAVKTYTILFTDGTTTTFDVTDGEVTLAQLSAAFPTDTASGAIASFEDGSDLFDYLSCIVDIDPVQAGSGTPSPDNVRPITGWTGCEVSVAGVNLVNINTFVDGKYISTSGVEVSSNSYAHTDYIKVLAGTTYYTNAVAGTYTVHYYDAYKKWIGRSSIATAGTFTPIANTAYVIINIAKASVAIDALCVNYPSTETSFIQSQTTTYNITWQTEAGTVYGGTVDLVTGVLTVTMVSKDLGTLNYTPNGSFQNTYNSSTLSPMAENGVGGISSTNMLCEAYKVYTSSAVGTSDGGIAVGAGGDVVYIKDTTVSDATALKTALNGIKLVYKLATPQTYQLDPVQVACLLRQNNVWADCGDIEEVKYKADVQLWVEKMLNA